MMKKKITNWLASLRKGMLVTSSLTLLGLASSAQSSLLTPADGVQLTIEGLASNTASITWSTDVSLSNPTYSWVLLASPSLSQIITVPTASDTNLVLDFATVNGLLASNGLQIGDTLMAQWYVSSTDNITTNNSDTFSISLVRGIVVDNFALLSPANMANLTIRGTANNEAVISWESAGEGANYTWNLIEPVSQATVLSVPTTDTSLSLSFEAIDDLLASNGIAIGASVPLQWNVVAEAANQTLSSNSNFGITLVRDTVLKAYNLLAPANQAALTVQGLGSITIDVVWESSYASGVSYMWYLDAANGDFTNPIIAVASNNSGTDTVLTLDLATIDAVLAGAGVTVGNTANLKWRVQAFGVGDSIVSSNEFLLDLTRGDIMNNFSLISPPSGVLLTAQGNANNPINISWQSAGNNVTYVWHVDLQGGSFNPPIASIPSNFSGTDTNLTLSIGAIDNLLASNGLNVGDTAFLSWTVQAFGTDTFFSNTAFDVNIVRGTVLNNFNLISPPNQTYVTLEGSANNPIDITWQQSAPTATYAWLVDAAGNNFSNPIAVVPANNGGTDTMLTLDFASVNSVLAGAGVAVGDTASLIWTVRAYLGGDSIQSAQTFDIFPTRGNTIDNFDLVFPTNAFAATIEGLASTPITISWQNAGMGANYTWELDLAGNSFANPIASINSNNNGQDTNLTLTFGAINSLLASQGVGIGNTANLIWRVVADLAGDEIASTSSFSIDLTRGATVDMFDILSPATATALNVAGAGSTPVDITWQSAGEGATYFWQLDLANNTFASPLASIAANNNGADTMLSLDFNAIDNLLASLGVQVGSTVNAIWRVVAIGGTDTLASTSTYTIDITRGNVLNNFGLVSPPNQTTLLVQGLGDAQATIEWQSASATATYEWYAGFRGDNFNTIVVGPISSATNQLVLDFATLDAVLGGANNLGAVFNIGDTAQLDWTVRAIAGTDTLMSDDVFEINLVRGNIYNPVRLINPVNGFTATVQNDANTEVAVNWTALTPGASYTWVLTAANNGPEIIRLPAGLDTNIVLPFGAIDEVLASAGVSLGATANLSWYIEASINNEAFVSDTFDLNLTRAALFDSFNLLSPPSGITLVVEGDANTPVNISWENAQINGESDGLYTWEIAVAGTNFSNPLLSVESNNAGVDTTLTLTIGAIKSLLSDNGLNPGDSIATEWRVIARNANDATFQVISSSAFELNLVQGIITSVAAVNSSSAMNLYPNPTNGLVWLTLPEGVNNALVNVYDITGKTVLQQQVNQSVNAINLNESSNLSGLYFISVQADEIQNTYRIIIK